MVYYMHKKPISKTLTVKHKLFIKIYKNKFLLIISFIHEKFEIYYIYETSPSVNKIKKFSLHIDNECLILPVLQVMDNGKVLFVNAREGEHTWLDPRTGRECHSARRKRGPFFSSPPSPLSLMDVLTLGTGDREALVTR